MMPAVQLDAVDVERLAFIEHVARALQATSGKVLAAMTGGSALRLCHGLPRPSFDLDLDVSARRDWLSVVKRVVERSPWKRVAETDQKRRGRGYIRVAARTVDGKPWSTKVDVRVCDGANYPALGRNDCETVNGIVVRRIEHIAERKREKLLGADYRQQGRDLYDFSWLVAARPGAVPIEDRVRLRDWLLGWSAADEARWREAVDNDRALGTVDGGAVLEAVFAVVDNDPGLRFFDARSSGAALAVRTTPSGTIRLGFTSSDAADGFVALTTRTDAEKALGFAMDHGLDGGQGVDYVIRLFRSARIIVSERRLDLRRTKMSYTGGRCSLAGEGCHRVP